MFVGSMIHSLYDSLVNWCVFCLLNLSCVFVPFFPSIRSYSPLFCVFLVYLSSVSFIPTWRIRFRGDIDDYSCDDPLFAIQGFYVF